MSSHPVSFDFELNITDESVEQLRKVQTLLFRAITLLRRMGLPEDVDNAVLALQRLIAVTNQLRLTLHLLELASGPLGWALFSVSAISTVMAASDMMMELGSG